MDNFSIDITAEDDSDLLAALKIAFHADDWPSGGRTAVAWSIKDGTLIFLWHDTPGGDFEACCFPTPVVADSAFCVARDFLRATTPAEREPDIDGSCSRGFRRPHPFSRRLRFVNSL